MKAIVYQKNAAPELLVLREIDLPTPGEQEVLIRIHAVGLNAADYRSMRMGIIPRHKIFGADVTGRVEAVGRRVTRFKPGDEVFGDLAACGFGGLAEYAVGSEALLAHKPAGLSDEEAAALPMAAVTALQGLRDHGGIRAGEKVLIYGAGGGVGNYAVQLAKHFGARLVAVCGPRNLEIVRGLGADEVIDYTREDVFQNQTGFDLIFAVNGSRPLREYRRGLTHGGRLVVAGGALTQVFSAMIFGPVLSLGSRKVRILAARPSPADLETLGELAAQGKLRAVIDRRYPLEEAPQAMRYLGAGHAQGKVIITVC